MEKRVITARALRGRTTLMATRDDDERKEAERLETVRRFSVSGMSREVAESLSKHFSPEPPEPADARDPAAPFDQMLYEALRAEGIDEPMARELASEWRDGDEVEIGGRVGERKLLPTKQPGRPGRTEVTMPLTPKKAPTG